MIVVRVELWSAVTGKVTELARAEICNIGGNTNYGDYDVRSLRGRSTDDLNKRITQRAGIVARHPRLREHVWNLVAKSLTAMGYGKGGAA